MDDKSLYAAILGIKEPWSVERVELKLQQGEIHIWVALPSDVQWVCPECERAAPIHDHKERQWRHLDTCQYRTFIHARVPRFDCPTHGIKQLRVPWAEPGSQFTALFEALAIDWLRQASISAVAKQLRLSWDEAAGIQERAVRRGLARRKLDTIGHIGIDETSFRKHHNYVMIVSDLDNARVLFVGDERKTETLDPFWASLSRAQLEGIEAVAMDIWDPYIRSTKDHLPDALSKIVFDKFHVARQLSVAVDTVRKRENRELLAQGKDWLKGTKYDWLRNPNSFSLSAWRAFLTTMRKLKLATARAWALKEDFMTLWDYRYLQVAQNHFDSWYSWARRSRLEPIMDVAVTLKNHWGNIKTYFNHRITNAAVEAMNSRIQRVKQMARGFRNRSRFHMAIYFHCGDLDLHPEAAKEML
jgi:transposase